MPQAEVAAIFSDKGAYRYLPRSLAYLPPAAEMLRRLAEAGFEQTNRRLLTGGAAQLITARRA